MNSPAPVERRRFPRVAVDYTVRYRPSAAAKGARVREDRLMTVGEGGCFIQTKLTYPKGTELDLKLDIDGQEFAVRGEVVYSIPFNPKVETVQFPGMGLQFINLPESLAKHIRKIITREQLKSGLGMSS